MDLALPPRWLTYVQNNGVNSVSIDLPNCAPGNLKISRDPRSGLPLFNAALFTPNALGRQGNCGVSGGSWEIVAEHE